MKKYRIKIAWMLCLVFLLGALSACKLESVAEHESRLAEGSTILLEEVQENSEPEAETAGQGADSTSFNGVSNQTGAASSVAGSKGTQQAGQANGGNGNASNGQGNAVNGGEKVTAPGKTTTAPDQNPVENITVTISITCAAAVGNSQLKDGISLPPAGMILANSSVTVKSGTTVFHLLKEVCEQKNIDLVYQNALYGSYVQKIGPIGEKDCGSQSGWTYRINGTTPAVSADRYKSLKNGDNIEWVYVTHA